MPPAGFETTISAVERPQTHALDLAATGMGALCIERTYFFFVLTLILLDSQDVNTDTNAPNTSYLVQFTSPTLLVVIIIIIIIINCS
jgi:hypothetical protein